MVEVTLLLTCASFMHVTIGLLLIPLIGLRCAIPDRVWVADLLGREIRLRVGIDGAPFDRFRLVVHSSTRIRWRA